ncbi:hypothetical protein QBC37DRAFT_380227 [Rhypophila decipiens]|uniref:Uncharacterized protein n=1 Tax=Rhypophila decipiens TaxID=261697 RepID=A0AAN6Y0Y1_9PEZI|nr:hypothetical protein QBC37DRAFT_380227 [Rhypophila decipiens]
MKHLAALLSDYDYYILTVTPPPLDKMLMLGGKLFTSLVDSIWARPEQDPTVMDIDPRINTKRKLAEDAYVEVEKRRCGYISRIIRPMRIMKPGMPSFFLHEQIPRFIYTTALKANGKRLCPSVFKIPVGKRVWHAKANGRPNRTLRIPLFLRRSPCIFLGSEGKRSRLDALEHADSKKLHKELHNQALHLHFRYYDWGYQPAPRKRFPRLDNHNRFRRRATGRRDPNQAHFDPALTFFRHFPSPSSPGMDIDSTPPATVPLAELEMLSLSGDSDSMEGLEVFSNKSRASFSSSSSWGQVALDPDIDASQEPNKGPLQFFRRQLENLTNRPLFLSVRQSYSAGGPMSM